MQSRPFDYKSHFIFSDKRMEMGTWQIVSFRLKVFVSFEINFLPKYFSGMIHPLAKFFDSESFAFRSLVFNFQKQIGFFFQSESFLVYKMFGKQKIMQFSEYIQFAGSKKFDLTLSHGTRMCFPIKACETGEICLRKIVPSFRESFF